MKKHMSVFMLMARSTIYRVLGLLAVLVVAEVGLFMLTFSHGTVWDSVQGSVSLEGLIAQSRISWVFCAIFLFVTVLLMASTGYETKGKYTYTLMRLSVSRRWVFFWQSLYNMVCYLLLWAVQILTVVLLCRIYVDRALAEHVTGQTAFLAFYRSNFLHSLLPFEDVLFWMRNVFVAAGLSITTARYPSEKGKAGKPLSVLVAFTVLFFVRELGDYANCIFLITAASVCILFEIYRVFREEEAYEA